MKTVKIVLSVLLALALTLSLGAAAFAETAELSTTKAFLRYMDRNGDDFEYAFEGAMDSGEEIVSVDFSGSNCKQMNLYLFFDPDEDAVCFRFFNLIDFDESDTRAMMQTCNDVNYTYKWVCFYVDQSDYSVTAEIDAFIHPDSAGEVTFDLLNYFVVVVDATYESFSPYAI